ncbi:cupredoxin domain-containing protein [Patescibacteria group bacterium]|nr:cupredoxin domain-containing protein [Patescibacteria group bacterium]
MKGVIIGVIIVVVIGAFAWFFFASNQTKTQDSAATTTKAEPESTMTSSEDQNDNDLTGQKNEIKEGSTVTYSDSGFSPQSVTVKSGENITWVNDSNSTVQVGSANHPTHTINQQMTGDEFVIELAPGESETVQLTKTGNWGYHDHLKPSMTGSITVE